MLSIVRSIIVGGVAQLLVVVYWSLIKLLKLEMTLVHLTPH